MDLPNHPKILNRTVIVVNLSRSSGVGEVPIVPPMAAIANAIARATGVRMEHLPMSPGAMLEAMWAEGGEPAGLQSAD